MLNLRKGACPGRPLFPGPYPVCLFLPHLQMLYGYATEGGDGYFPPGIGN